MSKRRLKYDESDKARRGAHPSSAADRAEFEVDKGRIIHSAAFRRLQGKTAVLGVGERDFYRTRLTHSLEVAQLGRGLCEEVAGDVEPDPDLVEAICLAHDIGHPAFGHSGERHLDKILGAEHGGFGANPQNLRIVASLEPKYENVGLDLTRATLDGLVKYPELYDSQKQQKGKFTYASDQALLEWIKEGVKQPHAKPLEGQLADWADQMAYSVNDIEDVVRAGLLSFVEMRSRAEDISVRAEEKYKEARIERGEAEDPTPSMISRDAIVALADEFEERFAAPKTLRERKVNLKKWTSDTIKSLRKDSRIQDLENSERSERYTFELKITAEAEAKVAVLKATAFVLIFKDPRVTTLEAKGGHILKTLFDVLSKNTDLLPLDFQELIKTGKFGSNERLVADFIGGMTDRYAYLYYSRLFQPGSGSFYEDV
jgi:dGTPase